MTSGQQRRDAFLQELGIGPAWKRRNAQPSADTVNTADTSALGAEEEFLDTHSQVAETMLADAGQGSAPSSTSPPASEIAAMPREELKLAVSQCTRCGLCASRTKAVFGVGDQKAKWLFIGEGPGRNEDLQGEPFVGPAGKLLDNLLLAMGLRRGANAYIANIVKCRPTGADGRDRPPTPEETATNQPKQQRQNAMIKPAVIVALGKTAAISLLGLDQEKPVGTLRGKVHRYEQVPLGVTYHPAYLLRKLTDKSKAWDDLCLAMNAFADERHPAN